MGRRVGEHPHKIKGEGKEEAVYGEEEREKERKIKLALANLMTLLYSDKSLMSSS